MGADPFDPTTPPPPGSARAKRKGGGPLAKENRNLVIGLVVGAIFAAFAVVNLDDVQVDWIFTTSQTPLIVVIVVCFALGAIAGWAFGQLRKKKS